MFTLEQITNAHAKVKSGADFPGYIRELKLLGISAYEHVVSDGHIVYYGADNFSIVASSKWIPIAIAATRSLQKLQKALTIHQQGQTDYFTFCRQSAEAGVEKWVVDIAKMSCIYYDKAANELLAEAIPVV